MSKHTTDSTRSKGIIIDAVEITSDILTARAGLSLFVRYLRASVCMLRLRPSSAPCGAAAKGLWIGEIFKQLFCFFVDGTSRHLVYFDSLKEDEGYAGATETEVMLSSHAVRRFFRGFWWPRIYLFRRLLQRLFLWRLGMEKPPVVMLGVDTMVMDNDDAHKRHGVKPTYKKVKGFQPLQMSWGRFVLDAVFRRGDAHSNHSDTVEKMVRHVVGPVRKHYRADVPIVLRLDSGFFDQKLMEVFDELEIGYVIGGKLYDDIKAYVSKVDRSSWGRYEQGRQVWAYVEMGDKRRSWKRFHRGLFCRPLCEEGQLLLEFSRPDTLLYSNLGRGEAVDHQLIGCARSDLLKPEGIIGIYHGRGSDELVHRALKDFGFEELPFKRFAQNAAFY